MAIYLRPKRQSKRFSSMRIFSQAHEPKNGQVWLNVTALVDMMTVLVIFLIMQMSTSPDLLFIFQDLTMPKAFFHREIAQGPVVSVTKNYDVYVQGSLLGKGLTQGSSEDGKTLAVLKDRLLKLAPEEKKEEGKGRPVNVQIDEGVPFSLLKQVIHTCEAAGFDNIRFSVLGASS